MDEQFVPHACMDDQSYSAVFLRAAPHFFSLAAPE
jgi:hypothetical protein